VGLAAGGKSLRMFIHFVTIHERDGWTVHRGIGRAVHCRSPFYFLCSKRYDNMPTGTPYGSVELRVSK